MYVFSQNCEDVGTQKMYEQGRDGRDTITLHLLRYIIPTEGY